MRGKFLPIAAAVFILAALPLARWPARAGQNSPPNLRAPRRPAGTLPPTTVSGRVLRTVVIDAAHGGTDEGARGASGVVEKDVVLSLAQEVAAALKRQGFAVVLTRQGDENPTFDERAAIANAQPGAIFLSLHVSSTGPVGTARVYYYGFGELALPEPAPPQGIARWIEAQRPWADLSQRLSELLQVELAEHFRGSSELPLGATVYQLRLIAAPAVAVELSSVAVGNQAALEAMGPAVAAAVMQGIASFRPVYEGNVK